MKKREFRLGKGRLPNYKSDLWGLGKMIPFE